MSKLKPIILAGGVGTRLWPSSRQSFPKQFSNLFGEKSLFEETLRRTTKVSSNVFSDPIVVTNHASRFTAQNQMKRMQVEPDIILVEPFQKNTAAAILASTIYAQKQDRESLVVITPSDHMIGPGSEFDSVVSDAFEVTNGDSIILLGVDAARPETGYGYIKALPLEDQKLKKVSDFIEKPHIDLAKKLMDQEGVFWNTGIVIGRAAAIISSFERFAKDLIGPVERSLAEARNTRNFLELNEHHWSECKNISFDFAVLEKADNIYVREASFKWSDVGDWNSVWHQKDKTPCGVSTCKNSNAINCADTLLRSENNQQMMLGLGLKNIIAIATNDAILIADKDKAQQLQSIVANLQERDEPHQDLSPVTHRPWGFFETLLVGSHFQVKKLCVFPQSALSLQSHEYRSEHWIVVKGKVKVRLEEQIMILTAGQSVFIPVGKLHRLENPTKNNSELIEIQTGSYLGEDDIKRFSDQYNRT